ncbi:alkene reductase [Ectopseudomonas hydrolytica]|uniref:alkene reductase n=1 Tax=Ectopseudomonas hydrolytica TaxID=2493633 RepID=UPI00376EA9B6
MTAQLLSPARLHDLDLRNHMVMAPMTRSRADAAGVPRASTATYYAQRASAGLIISEAINISADAVGSPLTPGLYSDKQIAAWQQVTAAVHAAGGKIFAQLWHTGRVGHSSVRGGVLPVAPSAVAIQGQQHFTLDGMQDYEVPRELTLSEIRATVADYRHAAENAKRAGFDGVELHAAFGYLPNQFLVDSANLRTDEYGGSIAKRSRFVLEVMQALIDVWGPTRVGIKLSPVIPFNSMIDSDPLALYSYLLAELNKLQPGYVHLMRALYPLDNFPHWPRDVLATFGPQTYSPLIANGGYDAKSAEAALKAGEAALVSFGTPFVANPDLPERFARGAELAQADRATLYGGEDAGFIDYPSL